MVDIPQTNDVVRRSFTNLRSKIFGKTREYQINKIDNALNNISQTILNKDSQNYSEMIKDVFTKALDPKIFKNYTANMFQSIETSVRYNRYANAQDIVDHIPMCSRALKVITDEIIAPDDVTKRSLKVIRSEFDDPMQKTISDDILAIRDTIGIDDKIYDIIQEVLKFGDTFVEITNYKSKDVPITQTILSEGTNKPIEKNLEGEIIDVTGSNLLNESVNCKIQVNIECEESNINELTSKESKNKEEVPISDIKLIQHDPRCVVKLQTKKYKMCLGYLVIPNSSMSVTGGMGAAAGMGMDPGGVFGLNQDFSGMDKIYTDILHQIQKYVQSNNTKDEMDTDKVNIKEFLNRALNDLKSNELNKFTLRYVPHDRMEHFTLQNQRYFPYGEGIFSKVEFQAKLFIALQTATTIKRISDSSEKRIMNIETSLSRDARNLVEELKEQFKKRKHSIDTFGNISSIPSMITSYEDIYVPSFNGKRVVEFDRLEPSTNVREQAEELKFFRDILVAGLDVPPAYLNLEENLSNKSALSHENMLFARNIVSYQHRLSKHINGLFGKIYKMTKHNLIPSSIQIELPEPKMLQFEREAENIDTAVRIVTSLKELGIPENYLKEKYLPIEWEEIKKLKSAEELDKHTKTTKSDDQMGGGFSGGF